MTQIAPMNDAEGTFSKEESCDRICNKCGAREMVYEKWDSSCGGYTDYKYTCKKCGHGFWIDGPDA